MSPYTTPSAEILSASRPVFLENLSLVWIAVEEELNSMAFIQWKSFLGWGP